MTGSTRYQSKITVRDPYVRVREMQTNSAGRRDAKIDFLDLVTPEELKTHSELERQRLEMTADPLSRYLEAVQIPSHPGKKNSFLEIRVLVGMKDVPAIPKNEIGNHCDQPLAVWARHQQSRSFPSCCFWRQILSSSCLGLPDVREDRCCLKGCVPSWLDERARRSRF